MMKKLLLLTVLLLAVLTPAAAQPIDSPFLRMLARVPDTPAAYETFSYADYRALVAARPGAPSVTSWAEYAALNDDQQALFLSALQGLNSGPDAFARAFLQSGEMAAAVGFDLLNVERAAAYGNPPAGVTLLEGDFNADAVIAAHEARGYTASHAGDLMLLCGANGCENGLLANLSDRNPANPFGGELGRNQPVLVGQRLVASSPSSDALALVEATLAGKAASLSDQPDYRAAAEAITANGTLLQALFIRPADILPLSSAGADNPALTARDRQTLLDRLRAAFVPLPQYTLIAFADTLVGGEQVTIVALVYTNQADALATAALFPAQLEDAQSFLVKRPFRDVLTERGVTAAEAAVCNASTKRSVVTITLRSPLPAAVAAAGERPAALSRVYAMLARAYYARDLGWLATQF